MKLWWKKSKMGNEELATERSNRISTYLLRISLTESQGCSHLFVLDKYSISVLHISRTIMHIKLDYYNSHLFVLDKHFISFLCISSTTVYIELDSSQGAAAESFVLDKQAVHSSSSSRKCLPWTNRLCIAVAAEMFVLDKQAVHSSSGSRKCLSWTNRLCAGAAEELFVSDKQAVHRSSSRSVCLGQQQQQKCLSHLGLLIPVCPRQIFYICLVHSRCL